MQSAAGKKIVFVAGTAQPRSGRARIPRRLFAVCKNVCGTCRVFKRSFIPTAGQRTPARLTARTPSSCPMDGGPAACAASGRPLGTIGALMKKGVGLACIHWAVEPTKEKGEKEFLQWMGGAYEVNWSVNPTWTANFATLPDHPSPEASSRFKSATNGIFTCGSRPDMKGVTPILSAVAPASTMDRRTDPMRETRRCAKPCAHSETQTVAWAYETARRRARFWLHRRALSQELGQRKFSQDGFERVALDRENGRAGQSGWKAAVTDEDLKANLDAK